MFRQKNYANFYFIVSIFRDSRIFWCVGCYASFLRVCYSHFLSILVLEFMDVYLEVHAMT